MNFTTNKINIAIDGWSACGKGTLAKGLAEILGYIFIDSGAMYRAFTYAALQNNINHADIKRIDELIQKTQIDFKLSEKNSFDIHLNGNNVEHFIRDKVINENVSHFSALSNVRRFLVAQQQQIAKNKGVVMDGRDIGTVVLPNAELKIFMTASPEIRAQRRFSELKLKNPNIQLQDVAQNLAERDFIDSTRADSPLKKADDARILDNSMLNKEEQLKLALQWAKEIILQQKTN
jgi:cytidylate kinase